MKELKVLELFAGVGGFRIGLENSAKDIFKTKWSNQWEPSRKSQDAFEVYSYHYPDSMNLNEDISKIPDDVFKSMDADMIVGGFPCQDYSVARSKKNEKGIEGKKGVLFWDIIRAVTLINPKYLILENVDRLLKAPSKQRGRDFAVMLAALNQLNYSVEWRVINAADYGRAQRRKRVFFFVYRNDLPFAKNVDKSYAKIKVENEPDRYKEYLLNTGLFATQFPVKQEIVKKRHNFYELEQDILDISESFTGQFWNTGVMRNGKVYSIETAPTDTSTFIPLGEILEGEDAVDEKYFITDKEKIDKFNYLRGPKKIERLTENGHTYTYSEGGMSPFDDLTLPGRTMLTSEGTVNRSTHFLKINDRYRLITPIEAERLQDFPDNWTKYKRLSNGEVQEVTDKMRMFFMGNALVTEVIRRIGDGIKTIVEA